MKNTESIKKNENFLEIYRNSKSYANKYLVMYVQKNEYNHNRLGISVSKKVGNSVTRHRVTRLIRESYRRTEENIKKNLDIIVVARVGAKGKSYNEIESALIHLMKLHKIWDECNL